MALELKAELLTAADQRALQEVSDRLWDQRADIAAEWARRTLELFPENFPAGHAPLDILTAANEAFLGLVFTHLRSRDLHGLYQIYYDGTFNMVQYALEQSSADRISLASLYASARVSLMVIGERLTPGPERHVVAYLKLANELMMVAGQAYSDCRERYLQRVRELTEADRRKNEFLAMLAHELRNPLAPINNAVTLLNHPDVGAERAAWARGVIGRQVQQLARLVDDLLDVARITRGKISLQTAAVDLGAVIQDAIETCRPLIEARGHTLHLQLPERPILLHADATRLAQVIGNLLNNAAKYTEPGGRICLSAEPEDREVIIRVRDTGIGIAADTLPHIFDLFTQAAGAAGQAAGGLGIGLTLVHRLVAMHGGSVQAFSSGPGQGSEFVVRLPLPTDIDHVPSAGQSAAALPVASPRRVLVVDDNADAAESLALLLPLSGHEVRTAPDGPAALAEAHRFRPDVIILDIGLPGMNGYEVARCIRTDPSLHSVRLVALTGYGQDEDRQRTRAAGFDAHLTKPIELQTLLQLLDVAPTAPLASGA